MCGELCIDAVGGAMRMVYYLAKKRYGSEDLCVGQIYKYEKDGRFWCRNGDVHVFTYENSISQISHPKKAQGVELQ